MYKTYCLFLGNFRILDHAQILILSKGVIIILPCTSLCLRVPFSV